MWGHLFILASQASKHWKKLKIPKDVYIWQCQFRRYAGTGNFVFIRVRSWAVFISMERCSSENSRRFRKRGILGWRSNWRNGTRKEGCRLCMRMVIGWGRWGLEGREVELLDEIPFSWGDSWRLNVIDQLHHGHQRYNWDWVTIDQAIHL